MEVVNIEVTVGSSIVGDESLHGFHPISARQLLCGTATEPARKQRTPLLQSWQRCHGGQNVVLQVSKVVV